MTVILKIRLTKIFYLNTVVYKFCSVYDKRNLSGASGTFVGLFVLCFYAAQQCCCSHHSHLFITNAGIVLVMYDGRVIYIY